MFARSKFRSNLPLPLLKTNPIINPIDPKIMTHNDAKLLGKVYSLLLEHGAVSTERAMFFLNRGNDRGHYYYCRDLHWAFYQMGCQEGGGLWILPDTMLPVNEMSDSPTKPESIQRPE